MPKLKVTDAELQKLNHERYYYPCPIVQKRIHAIYYKALGKSNKEISDFVGLNREIVGDWVRRFKKGGFEALCQYNYGTNKSEMENYSDSILSSFSEQPPMNANEAKARIEKISGVNRSPTQVRKFMKAHGLRYLKTGHIPAKADVEEQKKWVANVLDPVIKEAKNGKCHLLFMDASHFVLMPFLCSLWSTVRLFIKSPAGRNRINVLGVVNAITKEIITINNTTYITAETIVDFFTKLRTHYGSMDLKIVLDNARYQHCDLVINKAKSLNITLLFLPTYSPNLNIIERLWKFTKKKILYAKYYDSPSKFHVAINTFFNTINQQHNEELHSLMSLKFQFFQNVNAINYTV